MKNLTGESIKIFREKLKQYVENFQNKSEIEATRERALTLISSIYGDESSQYKRFRDVGFSSWTSGSYTQNDINTFISILQGILDTLDVLEG